MAEPDEAINRVVEGGQDPALDALTATFSVDSGPLRAGESDREDPLDAILHGVQHVLVLPPGDAPVLALRAPWLH